MVPKFPLALCYATSMVEEAFDMESNEPGPLACKILAQTFGGCF